MSSIQTVIRAGLMLWPVETFGLYLFMSGKLRPRVFRLEPATRIFIAALSVCCSCVGQIGELGSSPGQPDAANAGASFISAPTNFTCDANARPPAATLRRLTMTQYQNTLRDLVGWALNNNTANASTVMQEVAMPLSTLPTDQPAVLLEHRDQHGTYRRLDQTLQPQFQLPAFYAIGTAIGASLTTPARLGTVVGSCATDSDASNDSTCLTQFIQRFGTRALRRPVTQDDITFLRSVYGSDTAASGAAYADVINVLLNEPEFIYFVEHGDAPVPGQAGVYTVSAYELASRLSYQFWDTSPDDELLQHAADGSLLRADVYAQEVDRVFADARTKTTIAAFFADWFKVQLLPVLDAHNSDATYHTFAGSDLPGPGLRQEMIDDVAAMVDYYVWTRPSALSELLTSELSFARGTDLARIYGVAPWDGTSTPPMFPSGERPGILTRAMFLASGDANTHPILKGVYIRRYLLCDELGMPPAGAAGHPPMLSPTYSTRQVVEQLTQMQGSVCAGCHTRVINPLGFATEDFDALGRHRTAQRLFDADGGEVGTASVDTTSIPLIMPHDPTLSSGAQDLTRLIVASQKPDACMARNYFRFTFARWEDLSSDGCALENILTAARNTNDMRQMLKAVALAPSFRERAFE